MGRRKTDIVSLKAKIALEREDSKRRKSPAIEPYNPKAFVRMLPKGTRVSFQGHPILNETDRGIVLTWFRDRVTVQLTESSWLAAGCKEVDVIPERLKVL